MKKTTKKLVLARETVRVLDPSALDRVAGGMIAPISRTAAVTAPCHISLAAATGLCRTA